MIIAQLILLARSVLAQVLCRDEVKELAGDR